MHFSTLFFALSAMIASTEIRASPTPSIPSFKQATRQDVVRRDRLESMRKRDGTNHLRPRASAASYPKCENPSGQPFARYAGKNYYSSDDSSDPDYGSGNSLAECEASCIQYSDCKGLDFYNDFAEGQPGCGFFASTGALDFGDYYDSQAALTGSCADNADFVPADWDAICCDE